jgi:hypothetical protein
VRAAWLARCEGSFAVLGREHRRVRRRTNAVWGWPMGGRPPRDCVQAACGSAGSGTPSPSLLSRNPRIPPR